MNSTTSSISGTMDGIVYKNWRYGNFSYHFPLANGTYSMAPKFAESNSTASQQRFDIRMEGHTVLSDFSVYAQAGQLNAYDVAIPVSVSDGILVEPLNNPEIFTISASAGNGGNITPSGTTSILSGGSKSFAITPNVGSVIADVTVDGVSIGPRSSYTFSKVSSNHTIQASFASNVVKTIFANNRGEASYTDPSNHAYLSDTGGNRSTA